uniref:Mas1 n=1 Tax=Arundo donax TaxID=35708 RepID=A0A0A9B0D0_ARUDO
MKCWAMPTRARSGRRRSGCARNVLT